MKYKMVLTSAERTMVIAALTAYEERDLALKINDQAVSVDPADDGPEVEIIRRSRA